MERFTAAYPGRIARDASGALAYLAANRAELEVAEERWPKIMFHTLREITAGAERELADSSLR